MADTMQEEVAGHEVTAYVLEEETTHNHQETDRSSQTYHKEARTSGVFVDGQGANVTVSNHSRSFTYEGESVQVDRQEQGVQVAVDGQVAGYTTSQTATVEVLENDVETEQVSVEATFVTVEHDGNTYGNGDQVTHDTGVTVGQGELSADHLNENPVLGEQQFANVNAGSDHMARTGGTGVAAGAGGLVELFLGDFTGVYYGAGASTVRCQDLTCQSNGVGQSGCQGVRLPFFLGCP